MVGFFGLFQAYMNRKDWVEAVTAFEKVLAVSADNKAAQNQIRVAKKMIKDEEARDRKMYRNIFAKMAEESTKVRELTESNVLTDVLFFE